MEAAKVKMEDLLKSLTEVMSLPKVMGSLSESLACLADNDNALEMLELNASELELDQINNTFSKATSVGVETMKTTSRIISLSQELKIAQSERIFARLKSLISGDFETRTKEIEKVVKELGAVNDLVKKYTTGKWKFLKYGCYKARWAFLGMAVGVGLLATVIALPLGTEVILASGGVLAADVYAVINSMKAAMDKKVVQDTEALAKICLNAHTASMAVLDAIAAVLGKSDAVITGRSDNPRLSVLLDELIEKSNELLAASRILVEKASLMPRLKSRGWCVIT